MTTANTIIGLRSKGTHPAQERAATKRAQTCAWISMPDTALCKYLGLRYIALDEIDEHPAEEDREKSSLSLGGVLVSLWEILFPDHERETYRQLEGDDMTPFTVYKSSNRYYVTDEDNNLATARYLGQAYVLAQVWELP